MKVYFIGAGPGAADLITLRGASILARVPLVMYAGSLVSVDMLNHCGSDCVKVDTAKLSLEDQVGWYEKAKVHDWDVARLHSGDPAIYGATAEQMRRLEGMGIDYEIIPGVSSFTASAAIIGAELTKPKVSQTIILTRTEGRASPMPEGETLESLASHRSTMAIFLSGANLDETASTLKKHYSDDTPIALVYKATWPQERVWEGTLGDLPNKINPEDWKLSTMLLIGEALSPECEVESRLYAADYSHRYRKSSVKT